MTFFEIRVPMWMWILSQVIGVISIILWFIIYQQKDKARQLGLSSIANLLGVVTTFLVGNYVKAGTNAVNCAKNAIFSLTNKNNVTNKKILFLLVCLFSIINVVVVVSIWTIWLDWVLLGMALILNYGKAFGDIHWVKIPNMIWNILGLVYAMMFMSITGMILHIVIISSIIIFYINTKVR